MKFGSWTVLTEENLSDHRHIFFDLVGKEKGTPRTAGRKKLCDPVKFSSELLNRVARFDEGKCSVEDCVEAIKVPHEAAAVGRPKEGETTVPYWWTLEIDQARNEYTWLRRKATCANLIQQEGEAQAEYATQKIRLRKLIRSEKRRLWRELWGQGYRIARKRLTGLPPLELTTAKKKEVIDHLFPVVENGFAAFPVPEKVRHFDMEELESNRGAEDGHSPRSGWSTPGGGKGNCTNSSNVASDRSQHTVNYANFPDNPENGEGGANREAG